MIRCGNTKTHGPARHDNVHHHDSVAQVRLCFAREDGLMSHEEVADDMSFQAAAQAERAFERHLETNDQYAYEVEQDELRAANGFVF